LHYVYFLRARRGFKFTPFSFKGTTEVSYPEN